MAAAARPRYAPEDPTLPKPWRALVDGTTNYVYFWNPQTNVTTYEKPTSGDLKPASDEPKPDPKPEEKPSPNQWGQQNRNCDAGGGGRGGDSQNSTYQNQGTRFANSASLQTSTKIGNGSSNMHVSEPSVQFQPAPRECGKRDAGGRTAAEDYRRQHEITVTADVPHPFATFDSTGFPSDILNEVMRAGFSAPTPIQAQSWPIALEGRDIVAVAKTGSGKTLGYVIPGFIHLKRLRNNSKMGPTVLVLSPTRELATQIQVEAEKFGRSSSISSVCLYGGAPKGPQLRDLYKGADVVIATPGRLNDILEMKSVSLDQVSYLVLDEADRMLDMGFEPQIRKIVNGIPPRRQTLMFTATWPKEVRKIAADLLNNPVQVNIGNVDELVANKSITQYVEVISPMEKQRRLEQILRSQEPGSKIIIFCATKRMCDQLTRNLTRQFGAAAIHGDKCQSERDSVLAQFRSGNSPILVATDVAARGLDVKDIRIVVNYDFPTGVEDYVHRIGRTGRAGAKGEAYTFFCDQDSKYASDLVKILEGADQCVPSELRDMVSRGGYGGQSRRWGSSSDSYGGGRSNAYSGGRSDSYGGGRSDSYGGGRSDSYGGGRSYGGRSGGSSYGGDKSDNTYGGRGGRGSSYGGRGGGGGGSSYGGDKSDNTYGGGGGGYGDQKPSYDRREESGQVWSHDKVMSSGGSYGNNSGGRSRSRSPVRWQA